MSAATPRQEALKGRGILTASKIRLNQAASVGGEVGKLINLRAQLKPITGPRSSAPKQAATEPSSIRTQGPLPDRSLVLTAQPTTSSETGIYRAVPTDHGLIMHQQTSVKSQSTMYDEPVPASQPTAVSQVEVDCQAVPEKVKSVQHTVNDREILAPSKVDTQARPTKQPLVSRFSWTTEATESTIPTQSHSRRLDLGHASTSPSVSPSPESSVPRQNGISKSHGKSYVSPSAHDNVEDCSTIRHPSLVPRPLAPIIARRRPVPRDDVETRSASSTSHLPKTNSNKDLPLSPPELASVDIITSLEAQLAQLAYRRRNVEKMIFELSHMQPKNPLVQDLAARAENDRKVGILKRELDDIRALEHELGLKHHRAWKRYEQEQPTCLWIRRVTA